MDGAATSTLQRTWLTPRYVAYVLLALSTVALWPSLAALGRIWFTMADYWHGPLVAAISVIWLLRRAQERAWIGEARTVPAALPILAALVLAWMIAFRANSELAQQLVIPLIPAAAILAALGPQALRRFAPPLGFLYFAIPIWELLVPFLQWLSTHAATSVLGLMDVPVKVEGNNVTIPSGTFSIIEGCSGRRYVVVGLACAYLAGHTHQVRGKRFVVLMLLATAAALVTNWLRIVTVIYAGHVTNMQHYFVAVEHKSLGYVLFFPMLVAIGYAAYRLGTADPVPTSTGTSPRHIRSRVAGFNLTFAVSLILLAAPPLFWARPAAAPAVAPAVSPPPVLTGEWQGPLPASQKWRPYFVSPASEYRASYRNGERQIDVYLNAYGVQVAGRELIFHRNSVIPAEDWTLIKPVAASTGTPLMVIAETHSGDRWVVATQYVIGGWSTRSPALAQLYSGVRSLWQPVPAGAVAFATPCGSDCAAATELLRGFWNDNGAILLNLIPTTFD